MIHTVILISILPFLYLLTQYVYVGGLLYAVGNVAGLVGAVLMMWQVILGMRFISHKLRPDLIRNTKLHIFLGTYGLVLVFLHPVLQLVKYGWELATNFDFSDPFYSNVNWGKLAITIFLLTWITSALFRKKIAYRYWLMIHYSNYLMIFFVFLHARNLGTFIAHFEWVTIYFNSLYLLFFALVIFRVARFLNIGKIEFSLVSKTNVTNEVVRYEFKNIGAKKINIAPGQFVFLRRKFFSESHPFTAMDFNMDSQTLFFSIKKVGKYTNFLSDLKKNNVVYIDGPYGVFTKEGQNDDPKVLIAGGIGITPFYSLIKNFANNGTYLLYSNKLLSEAVERDFFKSKLGNNYIDFVTQEKVNQKNVEEGRIDKEKILKYLDKKVIKSANIFVCGPVPFMNAVKATLLELGVSKNKIFIEEFSL